MSNARKLQTEIDRVMKKVDEGVDLFDEIWEKVYSAEQQNQKEKYEMDLKKEIKKLQRLRDQIKTWIGSSDVKDKDALLDARRLIETKMEQFKICEKETKTKTYSKEGLARAEKLDPAEEAKRNTTQWIGDYVNQLNQLVEDREVEIERLMAGKGKKTNKHIIEEYNQYVTNHKFHVNKLEGIMRLVNNDVLDVESVDALKEDLDYYIESYEDDDYQQAYDEEFFYDALGLDDLDVVNVDRVTNIAVPTGKKKEDDAASASSTKGSKEKKATKKSALSSVIPLTIGRARVASGGKTASTGTENNSSHSKDLEPTTIPAAAQPSSKTTPSKGGRSASTGAGPTPATIPQARSAVPAAGGGASMAAILKRETEQQEKERQKARQAEQLRQQQQQQQLQRQQQEALRQQQQQEALQRQQQQQQQEAALRQQQQQQEALRQQQQQEAAAKQMQQQQAAQQAGTVQQQAQQQAAVQQQAADKKQQQLQTQISQGSTGPVGVGAVGGAGALDILTSGLGGLNLAGVVGVDGSPAPGTAQNGTAGVISASGSGSTSGTAGGFGGSGAVASDTAGGAGGGSSYLSALNDGFATMPNATDNERAGQYSPQNPYPTPSSYPSSPSGIFDNPAIFEKLGTDCLFFIFYYAQGTYQQYLAARELKKQSWRFHKKYMTWFQRHEEPKVTTDEYEQGTYVYFDYETGWCTRIKTDFRFEYSYLEDSLQ